MRCCACDVSEEIVRILQEVEDEMVDILEMRSVTNFGTLLMIRDLGRSRYLSKLCRTAQVPELFQGRTSARTGDHQGQSPTSVRNRTSTVNSRLPITSTNLRSEGTTLTELDTVLSGLIDWSTARL